MWLDPTELKSAIYQYQIDQITEADDDIVLMAVTAATDEVKSYLRTEGKHSAPPYDVAVIFSKTGTDRHALLLELTKNVAVWYLIRLCNVDMMFDNIKDRYDRAVSWLKAVNRGETVLDLPLLTPDTTSGAALGIRFGSRDKFNHDY